MVGEHSVICKCSCLWLSTSACSLTAQAFHEDITELFGYSTDPLEVAVAGLLSGGNDFPSAASQLCSAMGLSSLPCLPGKGQGDRAQGMAPSSSPWEQQNSRPRRHIRDSQLFKRGLGSVRK